VQSTRLYRAFQANKSAPAGVKRTKVPLYAAVLHQLESVRQLEEDPLGGLSGSA
jgi:hypothetical protein